MIILIDNYDSFTHNLYQQIVPLANGELVRVIRNDVMEVDEVLGLAPSRLIISPGPSTPQNAGISVPLIRSCPPELPLLGVCLGMQALAEVFGGCVVRAPRVCHGKASPMIHTSEGILSGLPQPMEVGRYHSLIVSRNLPKELLVDGELDDGTIMALRHRTRPWYGVQFHPESLLTPLGSQVMANFLGIPWPVV